MVSKWLGESLKEALKKYGDLKYEFDENNYQVFLDGANLSRNHEKLINDALRKDMQNITYKELFENLYKDRQYYYLMMTTYKNHKVISSDFSYAGFNNTSNLVVKYLNENAIKKVYGVNFYRIFNMDTMIDYVEKQNPNANFWREHHDIMSNADEDTQVSPKYDETKEYDFSRETYEVINNAVNMMSNNDFESFLNNHKDEDFDFEKTYIVLGSNSNKGLVLFYTNDIENFYNLLANAYNQSEYSKESGIVLEKVSK